MSHKIPGHGEAILAVQFSPANSSRLATASGDKTARIWDTETGTPKFTLSGHTHWVLCVAWSPDGKRLATGSMDKSVRLWNPETGKPAGQALTGHAKWITNIAWEPYHLWQNGSPRLASASKDATIRVWAVNTGRTEHVLSGHKSSVSCVKWGGTGLIYSGSHDKTVRVWSAEKGTLVHTLSAHAHWVNHLALSSDFALRTSYFDHEPSPETDEGKRAKAKQRFEKAVKVQGEISERLVTASDDFTMYLWDPSQGTKPVARLLGHQKQVNHVTYSPDGQLIASASFDNHTKIWSARFVEQAPKRMSFSNGSWQGWTLHQHAQGPRRSRLPMLIFGRFKVISNRVQRHHFEGVVHGFLQTGSGPPRSPGRGLCRRLEPRWKEGRQWGQRQGGSPVVQLGFCQRIEKYPFPFVTSQGIQSKAAIAPTCYVQ